MASLTRNGGRLRPSSRNRWRRSQARHESFRTRRQVGSRAAVGWPFFETFPKSIPSQKVCTDSGKKRFRILTMRWSHRPRRARRRGFLFDESVMHLERFVQGFNWFHLSWKQQLSLPLHSRELFRRMADRSRLEKMLTILQRHTLSKP